MAMVKQGSQNLTKNVNMVNALNVFPVPDGDTGTNMNLTMTSGVKQLLSVKTDNVGQAAIQFAKGLLMGARGNSGVILSQLFRGFAKELENEQDVTAIQLAEAIDQGVQTAFKAVMKPVEGTILTVAKDAAAAALKQARQNKDLVQLMEIVVEEATKSLKRTPDLLPILKEVGVVDSGGQGLLMIYQGFLKGLSGEECDDNDFDSHPSMEELVNAEHHMNAQSFLKTEDIKYGYCTEFMVRFKDGKKDSFNEEVFRNELSERGDSLLVVSDDELVKVHVHTETPGHMLGLGQEFGELINIKIENMREQHTNIVKNEPAVVNQKNLVEKKQPYGIVTVAVGDGMNELFKSIGAQVIIQGGQTMNPSTEDIVQAIEDVNANTVFVLPNNSNIIMAAKQAADVADSQVIVIPTKTVPQGMAALLAYNPNNTDRTNAEQMNLALENVKSGQVTFAVRDTVVDGVAIKEDDFIGINEGKIVTSEPERKQALLNLIDSMMSEDNEIVTLIYGEDVESNEVQDVVLAIESQYSEIEVETHEGNQPVYAYIVSVE